MAAAPFKHFLVVSDFDQTLSFNDSGQILSDLLGITDFRQKVDGLALSNLVQQGAELAYLIRHDPAFRGVRRAHLAETGRLASLRNDIPALVEFLKRGLAGFQFSFYVISAAPQEVIQAALAGTVPADHIVGTEFEYDPDSGEALANLVQPFWMLPILGLFKLGARDVMGYTAVVFLALTPVVLILVTVLGLTLSYPLQAGSRRSAPPDAPARRSRRR